MKISKILLASSVLLASAFVASCSSTKPAPEPVKEEVKPEPVKPTEPVVTQNPETPVVLNTVYFDFNKYDIREDQKASANAMVDSLKANPNVAIQIQGNTDDRGSAEYNMALGLKRAAALKNYFVANGVTNQVETISYGKEKPAVQGDNEESWSKNRRDDVVKK